MAQYFDMLREEDPNILSNGKPEAALYESGSVTNRLINDLPLITPKDDAEASLLQRSGYVQNQDGTYQTPIRDLAQGMQQRELLKREAREIEYNKTRNSTMFKIGDALADTGRLFMSPLFWLSGEDTSKYDPSERLKTGYRKQFSESLTHTEGLYGRVQQAKKTRQDYRNQLEVSDMSRLKQSFEMSKPISTPQRDLYDFAINSGPENKALYNANTSDAFNKLQKNMMLATDKAIPLFGVDGSQIIVPKMMNDTFNTYGKRFEQAVAPATEAFSALDKLRTSLKEGTPLSEVAAVTQFNKVLDPGSVVRESEVRLTAEARGIYDELMVKLNNVSEGDVLTDDQVIDMLSLADALGDVYQKSYNRTRDDAEFKFNNSGYGDQNVITQYLGSRRTFTPPTTPENLEAVIVSDEDTEFNEAFNRYGDDPNGN